MPRFARVVLAGPHPWLLLPAFALGVLLGGCDAGSEPSADAPPPSTQPAAASASTSEAPASGPAWGQDAADEEAASLPVAGAEELVALIEETSARDRVLVIDFWATWCVPCVAMFPDLHAGLKERGEAVRPVSVTFDGPSLEGKAVAFLKQHGAMTDAYRVPPDGEAQSRIVDELGREWRDVVVPAILVFDRDGELAGEFLEGGDATVEAILQRVDQLVTPEEGGGQE